MFAIKVTKYIFIDQFIAMDREDQFSPGALSALFQYYENLSEECEESIELDVIAICCEWTEYAAIQEAFEAYHQLDDIMDSEELEELEKEHDGNFSATEDEEYKAKWEANATEKLEEDTTVIVLDNGGCLVRNW